MGLIQRIFKTGKDKEKERDTVPGHTGPSTTLFVEADDDDGDAAPRNAPRRELVQAVLRDTMRKHGIPSDWIECRTLSTVSREGKNGMHVSFVVRKAHDKLLAYVFSFQESFMQELVRLAPHSRDWEFSVGWQFEGQVPAEKPAMPDPKVWAASTGAIAAPAGLNLTPPAPAPAPAAVVPMPPPAPAPQQADRTPDDVQQDLAALFAIRDAAMARPVDKAEANDPPDFEPTRPFDLPPR